MDALRLGLVGLGNMGRTYAGWLLQGKLERARLSAVCDPVADLVPFAPAQPFTSSEAMIRSGEIDAILIATPHYSHTTIGIDALQQGLHVLVEKPLSVHKADCERLLAAHRGGEQVFGIMLNQRTDPHYLKLRELIQDGELGEIVRINWLITDWFRPQIYYRSSGWRATWAGEGGGVLLNQCPHNLDLFQWLFGLPSTVRALCRFGRYHDIEVEDEVTAVMEFENGASAVFVTSTGEAPGTNRLEVAAEGGRVVLEKGELRWLRNSVPTSEFSRTTEAHFAAPPHELVEIPVEGNGPQHLGILENFIDAILDGTPLLAPAAEGMRSVELANAMLMSAFLDRTVALPLDGAAYETLLREKIASSRIRENLPPTTAGADDFARSFTR